MEFTILIYLHALLKNGLAMRPEPKEVVFFCLVIVGESKRPAASQNGWQWLPSVSGIKHAALMRAAVGEKHKAKHDCFQTSAFACHTSFLQNTSGWVTHMGKYYMTAELSLISYN